MTLNRLFQDGTLTTEKVGLVSSEVVEGDSEEASPLDDAEALETGNWSEEDDPVSQA